MLKKIQQFIADQQLFDKTKYIICGTSGGVDSVCLLHVLHDLGYPVVLAHVNHHKRKESAIEQEKMKALADTLQIPFELLDFYDTHQNNFQNEAHQARYDFFKRLADQYHTKWIATAHHLDDQAETILMRLMTGSNLYGYAGISILQSDGEYFISRPLLCTSKDELYQYANQQHYEYFEDASNHSDDYFRNRLRHHVLPLLKQESPAFLEKLQEYSVLTKEAFQFIRIQSIKYLEEFNNIIEVDSFKNLDAALQKDIVCLLLEQHQIEKNKTVIEQCVQLILKNKNKNLSLKNNYHLIIEYGKVYLKQRTESNSYEATLTLEKTCCIQDRYFFYFSKNLPQNNAKYMKLCYNSLKLPFLIRNRKKGDFINLKYGSKKVSRVMIDAKVAKNKRDSLPLIFDSENHLLWIYPFVRSQAVVEQKESGDIYLVCEELNNE